MKILCKLPNAATVINGVKFFEHKLGVISEEIEDDVAALFLKIEGYVKVLPPKADTQEASAVPASSSKPAAPDAESPAAAGAGQTSA
ncbi:hypothetical protein [Paraburkholderia sp. MM6662-R1]|uniref:hypothetical protein n=1 Tax=Paraburkholderia sp. MM6662-R1 TaxID=2991066 RepID=UPI003D1F7200